MNKPEVLELNNLCKELRIMILEEIRVPGSGHVGGSFSIVEVLVSLYNGIMNIDPKNPKMDKRDRLVLSKGHAGPALYATLAQKGYFDREVLKTLNVPNTNLPSHVDMNKTPGIEMTCGSLGQGLSAAVGMAYGSKLKNDGAYIYCIIGDGESQEGQIWEAAMIASAKNLDNLIVFLDYNKFQLDGSLEEVINIGNVEKKWEAFGFDVQSIDGHDVKDIFKAVEKAKKNTNKPQMIVLNTIKGNGISFIQEMGYKNHSMNVTDSTIEMAIEELYKEAK